MAQLINNARSCFIGLIVITPTTKVYNKGTQSYVCVGPCEEGDGLAEAETVDHHNACQRAADAARLQNNYINGKYEELTALRYRFDTIERRTQEQQLEPHHTSAYGRLIRCRAI
jgi:hypothetical protein